MAATLRQVAEAASVSRATASRVLTGNGAELFAAETRRRIEEAARRLGYRPNHTARALATGRTGLMTMWSYPPYQAFFGLVLAEMQLQAQRCGYGLLVADITARNDSMSRYQSAVWPSDGVMAMDCGNYSEAVLDSLPSPKTPIVSMGTSCVPGTDFVRLDLCSAFAEAAEHLVAQGCKRIAYFTRAAYGEAPVADAVFGAPRQAYCNVIEQRGYTAEIIEIDTPTRDVARQTLVEYVRAHGCPEAILCRNDDLSIGAYRALCDLDLEPGRDALLIGCDGLEETRFMHCPLSTILLPVDRMCEVAWQFIEQRIADPTIEPRTESLSAKLDVRDSAIRRA